MRPSQGAILNPVFGKHTHFTVSKAIYSAKQHPVLFQTLPDSNLFLFLYVFMVVVSDLILLFFPDFME